MNKTSCITVDDHTVVVEKDGVQDIVYYVNNFVFVTQPHTLLPDHKPFIPWARVTKDEDEAHDEWYKAIGKLVRKDSDSKYFKKPHLDQHLKNGSDKDLSENEKKKFAVMVENVIDNCQAHKINI
ncbi:MAG: hypothetical protein K6B28_05430 [Lachnospiraceae bacterium]|nr:hypothetical protein [Lachnospiraceae bacterium]